MIVCNCNGINERKVQAAIDAGATRWKDVHAHYGCKPQCGQCQCEIVEAIAARDEEDAKSLTPLFGTPSLLGTS